MTGRSKIVIRTTAVLAVLVESAVAALFAAAQTPTPSPTPKHVTVLSETAGERPRSSLSNLARTVKIKQSAVTDADVQHVPAAGTPGALGSNVQQSAATVVIDSASTMITHWSSGLCAFTYKVVFTNSGDAPAIVRGTLTWVDKEGFAMDSSHFYGVVVQPDAPETITDVFYIHPGPAARVVGIKAAITGIEIAKATTAKD